LKESLYVVAAISDRTESATRHEVYTDKTTGEWFLDLNNNGVFDSGDVPVALLGSSATYRFRGVQATSRSLAIGSARVRVALASSVGGSSGCSISTVTGRLMERTRDKTPRFLSAGLVAICLSSAHGQGLRRAKTRVGVVHKYAPAGVRLVIPSSGCSTRAIQIPAGCQPITSPTIPGASRSVD
jgi:hypothetical protein